MQGKVEKILKEEVIDVNAFIHKIKGFTHKMKGFTHV